MLLPGGCHCRPYSPSGPVHAPSAAGCRPPAPGSFCRASLSAEPAGAGKSQPVSYGLRLHTPIGRRGTHQPHAWVQPFLGFTANLLIYSFTYLFIHSGHLWHFRHWAGYRGIGVKAYREFLRQREGGGSESGEREERKERKQREEGEGRENNWVTICNI